MLFINAGVALALLISYLAPVVDPRTVWVIAFFGLAYPPLLLLNVLFIIYWLILRSKLALVSVVTILVGFNVLLNNIGFSFSGNNHQANAAGSIRFMTYNVHSFRPYGDKPDQSTKHEILRILADEKPDVIGFQEFYSRKKGQYAILDSVKDILNTPHLYFEEIQKSEKESIGMAIFSRLPVVAKGIIALADRGSSNQCLYVDIKKSNQIIRFYSVHLQSISFEPQDYRYLDTVTQKGKADLSSTRRLVSKLKLAFLKRAEQVFKIKEHAAKCPYPYIISGDFNDTPTSFAVSQMAKGIQNTFRQKGFGLGRTYNGDFPNYQIDYIMASRQFNVLSYNIVQKKLSDHYPVYADIALK